MLDDKSIRELEREIDKHIIDRIDSKYPLYKYIYHLNLAHIDLLIHENFLNSVFEKNINSSLSANIHWAYKKLKPENKMNYDFDYRMYKDCILNIKEGIKYSYLCEEFPKIYSGFGSLKKIDNKNYVFDTKKFARSTYVYLDEYSRRNFLNSIMLKVCSKNKNMEDIDFKLSKEYVDFYAEQLNYEDFEDYDRVEWGGISFYLIMYSMRRWSMLYYKKDNLKEIHPSKFMICMSEKWKQNFAHNLNTSSNSIEKVMNDFIYIYSGKGLDQGTNICDRPVIKTKDNNIFVNPFIILSTHPDTRYLNMIKNQKEITKYLKLKDKIKERHIPFIIALIKKKIPNVKIISNFKVNMENGKGERELDLLLLDEKNSLGLYIEIKYFYEPKSFSQYKNLDSELNKAVNKLNDQISDLKFDWENVNKKANCKNKIKVIEGMIVSYSYLGLDIEVNKKFPILNTSLFYEAIYYSNTLEELIKECKGVDDVYSLPLINHNNKTFKFANNTFSVPVMEIDREIDRVLKQRYDEIAEDYVNNNKKISRYDLDIDSAAAILLSNMGENIK